MPIIPASIQSFDNATPGEKKLHSIFKKLYGDDEDVYVWYEPLPIPLAYGHGRRYTDFVIYNPDFGLLILEVKDWSKNKFTRIDNNYWFYVDENGIERKYKSPFKQVRDCFCGLMSKLQQEQLLVHSSGHLSGKLRFPIASGVVLTKISRSGFSAFTSIFDDDTQQQVLCKDDLGFNIATKDDRFSFESKLKNMFVDVNFDFHKLIDTQLKVLRKCLDPVLIIPPEPEEDITDANINELKVIDINQEDFIKNLGFGRHTLIKGVIGSGKTLIFAYRVFQIKKYHPAYRILFVCYNISLRKYFEFLINNISNQNNDRVDIDIYHYHALVKKTTGVKTYGLPGESDDDWDNRIGQILANHQSLDSQKYDAIFIDEAQDFSTLWLKGVVNLLNETDDLTIAFDPAQDIYGRKRVWKDAKISVTGLRSKKLKVSYRNTNEILNLALKFKGLENYVDEAEIETDEPLRPEFSNISGEKPIVKLMPYLSIATIKNDIEKLVSDKDFHFKDVAIITCSKAAEDFIIENYKQFDEKIELCYSTERRLSLNLNRDTIKCFSVESSKGLEWKLVYLLGIDNMPRKNRIKSVEKTQVYIGMTRATKLLRIYCSDENDFIRKIAEINGDPIQEDASDLPF